MDQSAFFQDTPGMLPIWTWECDLEGLYTQCSPEIILCLGISPDKVLGQSIFTFHIHPDNSETLKESLKKGATPAEISVLFQSSQEEWVKGKINIFELKDDKGVLRGWHGFNQILIPENVTFSVPLEAQTTPTPPTVTTLAGVSYENGISHSASSFWTGTGQSCLTSNRPELAHGNPAVLAVPFRFGNLGKGAIEIIDDTRQRTWKESERQLVEAVATQLSSTLERLLLHAVLDKEISDRTRAEEEILRRNQDLARIHQIGQKLSTLSNPKDVFQFLHNILGELIDNKNLIIAVYNKDQQVEFPVVSRNGEIISVDQDPYAASILGYVTEEKAPLLITGGRPEDFEEHRLSVPEILPASIMAVPLMAGERPLGSIILQDFQNPKAYNFLHMELLSTIATQATAALENANLFQEIRNALKAIEIRERYQAKIGKAVAILSQSGINSLNNVLELIGQASNCTRISYIQLFEAGDENRWKIIKTWSAPDYVPAPDHVVDFQKSIDSLPSTEGYPEKGWISGPLFCRANTTPNSDSHTIGSFLLLTVPGKSVWRSYISLEQIGSNRIWKNEEIDILKVSADALSNTLIREGLMEQLQASLNESESLFNASHHLALASTPKEMLATLSANLAPPQINKSILVLFNFDEDDQVTEMNTVAFWQNIKTGILAPKSPEIFPVSMLPAFQRATPVFYDDIRMAPLDDDLRNTLMERNIMAIGILPLWAGKRQLGFMLLCSERPYHFTNREMRTYPPLIDQMAIAIENAHAYELSQKAIRDMKEVDRLKSQFLATMTHELRSPLNSIIGFSQVILKGIDGPINDLQIHDLTAIYDSGQLLLNLINDVLDLSKIEAGKMEMAFSTVNLEEVIDAALNTTQGLIKSKPIKLNKEIHPLPIITADPIRIRQVLINLLSNAAKFTEMGSITIKAWVKDLSNGKKEVWVTVADTGVGIAPENQKNLFQAFSQVDSSHTRKTGGSGLGLSICHSLIKLHNGQIGILQSAPNQGSTFYFSLPIEAHPE